MLQSGNFLPWISLPQSLRRSCWLKVDRPSGKTLRRYLHNPVASHPRHRALFELKSVLSFYVQFWHSEANLNIPKISWYSQSPNILHKIGTFQNTVNFLGKILILLGFEFALCFFGFEMVAHGRFLQGIDVLHTVIESLRIIAGAGADKTETSR